MQPTLHHDICWIVRVDCGIDRLFGVPGDYTLQFLDRVNAQQRSAGMWLVARMS